MNQKTWLIGGLVIAALLVGGFLWGVEPQTAPVQNTALEQGQKIVVTVSVEGLYDNKKLSAAPGTTAFEALKQAGAEDSHFELMTKEYPGLGMLVTGMHGMMNGSSDKYWQYKVNGMMPQIGADQYKLKDGDSVEWYFAPSSE